MPWLVAVALFMENLDATIVNTAVPSMAASLGVEPLSLKAVLTSYTLCLAVFIPISGWMADRFGTRRVFTWAVVLFTLGSLFCGLARNIHLLVAARVIQGIGGAMMTPVGRLALVRTFPRSEMLAFRDKPVTAQQATAGTAARRAARASAAASRARMGTLP